MPYTVQEIDEVFAKMSKPLLLERITKEDQHMVRAAKELRLSCYPPKGKSFQYAFENSLGEKYVCEKLKEIWCQKYYDLKKDAWFIPKTVSDFVLEYVTETPEGVVLVANPKDGTKFVLKTGRA